MTKERADFPFGIGCWDPDQSNKPQRGHLTRAINQKVEIHSTLRMMTSQLTSDNLNLPQ